MDDWIKEALVLADKRERVCKNAKPCPECKTVQIQLISWIEIEGAKWKCRICKHIWMTED